MSSRERRRSRLPELEASCHRLLRCPAWAATQGMRKRTEPVGPATNDIAGVAVSVLAMHRDVRGSVCELFRVDWQVGFEPMQWHALTSRAGTLRGMHLHVRHSDYKIVIGGRETLVLKDLRRGSATEGRSKRLDLSADELTAVVVPPGVAHGIYSHDDSVTLVGSTALYDPHDEFEFHFADPGLGEAWPTSPRHVSVRDRNAQSLSSLIEQIEPFQPL
jgi:dTDP-4-dehydrorhamnose 3,5-epimerase